MRWIAANQGRTERYMRALLGLALVVGGALVGATRGPYPGAFVLAFYLLVTALGGWDPLYAILRSGRDGR